MAYQCGKSCDARSAVATAICHVRYLLRDEATEDGGDDPNPRKNKLTIKRVLAWFLDAGQEVLRCFSSASFEYIQRTDRIVRAFTAG